MTLNELKTGMIVETRDGDSYIVMRDFCKGGDILAGLSDSDNILNSYIELSNYEQDLKHKKSPGCDIMSVYSSYPQSIDIARSLLWKREEYREVTIKEIEEIFECKVKIVDEDKLSRRVSK